MDRTEKLSRIRLNRHIKVFWGFIFFLNVSFAFAQTIPVVDVSTNYPKKSILFQDIADVKYVALETSDHVLLDGRCKVFHVSDDYIVVSNPVQGDVFVFGGNGRIKYSFNHRGQGPAEYLSANVLVFDENNKEIFVYTRKVTPVFLVYSEDGKYKRTIKLPSLEGNGIVEAHNFDDENLLIYEKFIYGNFLKKPYMLLSKKDGTATSINITLPQRYTGFVIQNPRTDSNGVIDGDGISLYFNESNNRHYGQDFIIADISCDTIFQLKSDKNLTPILRRTPSVHNNSNPKTFLTFFLKTDKYMFMELSIPLLNSKALERHILMYNFSNGEINDGTAMLYFLSDDYPLLLRHRLIREVATQKNTLVYKIEAMHLYEQRSEIKGELQKIASTIDPEDNPVLMIAKLR